MKQCEDYNEINLYNTLVKKINEIIDELNKVDLQKLEMQRLLNTAYEIKNELNKIQMECNQVLDNINNIDNKFKDVKDLLKLINLLNIENKLNRLVKEFEGNHFTLTGSKNGVLEIESIQGNTLVNLRISNNCSISISDMSLCEVTSTSNKISGTIHSAPSWLYLNMGSLEGNTLFKPDTKYTIVFKEAVKVTTALLMRGDGSRSYSSQIPIINNKAVITTDSNINDYVFDSMDYIYVNIDNSSYPLNFSCEIVGIFEGDYTNKPIPNFFTGMQSSFEDKVVTQEMVDNGKELAENLGKYKAEYKVTGKNLFDKSKTLDGYYIYKKGVKVNPDWFVTDFIQVIPNTSYKISGKDNGNSVLIYDKNKQVLDEVNGGTSLIKIPSNAEYIRLNGLLTEKDTFQIEEGTEATDYEPYKEQVKTYYLNSPLLEGDTIEDNGNDVVHVHRWDKTTITGNESGWKILNTESVPYLSISLSNVNISNFINKDYFSTDYIMCNKLLPTQVFSSNDNIGITILGQGSKTLRIRLTTSDTLESCLTWLQSNPITVVYKLASPTKEVIGKNDNNINECYEGSSIDYDSVIPVEKTKVIYTGKEVLSTSLYSMEDDISLNDSGIELNSNDEEVF